MCKCISDMIQTVVIIVLEASTIKQNLKYVKEVAGTNIIIVSGAFKPGMSNLVSGGPVSCRV